MKNALRCARDVIVRTAAFDAAVDFYGRMLGVSPARHGDALVAFETGAFCLYVEKGPSHGPVFEFLVDDVQAEKRRLLDDGCSLVEEDASVPRCYLRDPYGLVFNLGRAR